MLRIRRPQDKGRAAHPGRVPAAHIRVEDIAAPVLVAGAHDDQVWDSGGMAESIAATRSQAGRETVSLVCREAGNALGGSGWSPTTQYNAGPIGIGTGKGERACASDKAVVEPERSLRAQNNVSRNAACVPLSQTGVTQAALSTSGSRVNTASA